MYVAFGAALGKSALSGLTIDILVHNAGSYDAGTASHGGDPGKLFATQKLDAVTMDTMKAVFDVNTLGPLRVAKALHEQLASPGGKLAIISTQLGSIDDNTSGGSYAYRSSKAAVNMVGKSLSCDLKAKVKDEPCMPRAEMHSRTRLLSQRRRAVVSRSCRESACSFWPPALLRPVSGRVRRR